DLNGVGLEVIIKTFMDKRVLEDFTPVIYASSKVLAYHRKALDIKNFNYETINDATEAKMNKVNLINCWDEEVKMNLGKRTEEGGKYAIKSLESATNDIASNKLDLLVTAPLDKYSVEAAGFNYPGQTEYLTQYANLEDSLMMMVYERLRVGLVTSHIPLNKVTREITTEKILSRARIMEKSLRMDFGLEKPKIAILNIDPHCGDKGMIGNMDKEKVTPAVEQLQAENLMVLGPYSSDGFFGSGNYRNFDGVLSMYHDQGLTPFKTISFDAGVNYTAGLPIVRTSPDHGTGFDIAGKNVASERSFRNAVFIAKDILLKRNEYKELTSNPLTNQE
ncbi:MAG: 4-hydroxythreonine-4-phosphate dehydrogenase PdxA, partial [Flavobacteriales bacterium]